MANFYTEHPELKFHLNNPMMERICQLKERNYRDKDEYDYAPQDFADAIDSYDKVLEITGEITDDPYGMDGCIAVTKVNNLQTLMKYICKNGFEHHVAMVRNDVKEILNEAIEDYLGWNLYVHE